MRSSWAEMSESVGWVACWMWEVWSSVVWKGQVALAATEEAFSGVLGSQTCCECLDVQTGSVAVCSVVIVSDCSSGGWDSPKREWYALPLGVL